MRRTVTVLLLAVLLAATVIPLAEAGDPPPLIITPYPPYLVDPDVRADAGQEVIIRAGWGACNRGLTEQFTKAASISMEITKDGTIEWLTLEPPSREYWHRPVPWQGGDPGKCVLRTNTVWLAEWFYSLGPLAEGEYVLDFHYAVTWPVVDGGDYNGDGRPDIISGVLKEKTTTIIVN